MPEPQPRIATDRKIAEAMGMEIKHDFGVYIVP